MAGHGRQWRHALAGSTAWRARSERARDVYIYYCQRTSELCVHQAAWAQDGELYLRVRLVSLSSRSSSGVNRARSRSLQHPAQAPSTCPPEPYDHQQLPLFLSVPTTY
jgi:hypothetical protein